MNKLHFQYKEVGRLTLKTFSKMYDHYKNDFDLELYLKATNKTYAKMAEEEMQSEEWIK